MPDIADVHTAMPTLQGRRVAITGGTTGIGRATALLLASQGARLFVCGRNPDHLSEVLTRLNDMGEGGGIMVDLSEPDNVKRFFDEAVATLGGLDVAIINAAVPAKGLSDMSEAEVRHAIALNFSGYVLSAHAAMTAMGDHGHIVLIGSMSANVLGGGSTVYAGIKAGIAGFAEALRRELGSKGIKVSLVEPGLTAANMHLPTMDAAEQADRIKGQSMLRAEDVAVSIQFCLTQPDRTVIQHITVVPRVNDE